MLRQAYAAFYTRQGAVMLIGNYDLEVFTPPCDPGAERYAACARLAVDISEVLPYLNATLRGAVYLLEAQALTWKKGGHNIAFHSYEIATSNVEDRGSAEKELKGLIDLVNRTWERRAEITPDTSTRQHPTPMVIFKLLPQTNCKLCGDPTCYTFALKLAVSQKKLADCPPLAAPQYAKKLDALQEIIIKAPAIG
jgi:ArsR family metal-binding transcriptional regulator